jgi:glycosyltransferase involved in cell wall biosynthesis
VVVGDPDDVDEVVAAFERLLDDDAGRRAMGVAARARAEAEFSYEVLSGRLWNTLRTLP